MKFILLEHVRCLPPPYRDGAPTNPREPTAFARSSLLKQAVQPMSRQEADQPSGKDKDKEKDGENASPIADDWDVDFGANSFGELTTEKRILLALVIFIKLCLVVGALYFFICALSFMATGFRLVSCSSSSVA